MFVAYPVIVYMKFELLAGTPLLLSGGSVGRELLSKLDLNPCMESLEFLFAHLLYYLLTSLGRHSLTLEQAARNTEQHGSWKNVDKKLRAMKIDFVPSSEHKYLNLDDLVHPLCVDITPQVPGEGQADAQTTELSSAQIAPSNFLPGEQASSPISSCSDEVVFVPRNRRKPLGQATSKEEIAETPHRTRSCSRTRRTTGGGGNSAHESEDIIEDYIQNIRDYSLDDPILSMRDLGGELDEIEKQSLDTLTVTDSRKTIYGTQYQFRTTNPNVDQNTSANEFDIDGDMQPLVDIYSESQILQNPTDTDTTSEYSDTEEEAEKNGDDDEAINDDEALARALQAEEFQSSHGNYMSSRLLFEDLDAGNIDDEIFDTEDLLDMLAGKRNKNGSFPSASRLADAYDDFDILDLNRPSLSRKSRSGRRKTARDQDEHGLSELEIQLQNQLVQDRERKRLLKEKRQQARNAASNIVISSNSIDIKSYGNGMRFEDVKTETRRFLINETVERCVANQILCYYHELFGANPLFCRLALVAMPKKDRLQIHIMANRLGLTSKSQGSGAARFPVLFKTKRTVQNLEVIDDILETMAGRGGHRILGIKGGAKRGKQAGGTDNSGFRHRDGTVVGRDAAEIGEENKGYAMLSKMGWTLGTGLGSKRTGILDPVQAVVKTSRTGLG